MTPQATITNLTLILLLLVGGCKTAVAPSKVEVVSKPLPAAVPTERLSQENIDALKIEKIPYLQGISSATVERLALLNRCEGIDGAGLITPKGPVEVYRLPCKDGKVFLARCELRQCKVMAPIQ
jgi:hypothetical protein